MGMRKLTFILLFFLSFKSIAQLKPTSATERLKTIEQKKLLLKNSLVNQISFRNIIYLELKRRNNQIWIGKTNNLEVDFVVRNNDGFTQYIQVSQTVQNIQTLERELAPFEIIPDHYEKLLITMDFDTGTYNGIKKINAIDWLLNSEK